MNTLDLINSTLSLIGERPLASSVGSMGGLTRTCLTTALQKCIQETRATDYEQLLTYTATNTDYLVSIGSLPTSASNVTKIQYRDTSGYILDLKYQPLNLLYCTYAYSMTGRSLFLSPMFARPCNIYVTATIVPALTADDVESGVVDYLIPCVTHTAAAILCTSYLDDANAGSLQNNIAETLVSNIRARYGATRAKSFNMGGFNV